MRKSCKPREFLKKKIKKKTITKFNNFWAEY